MISSSSINRTDTVAQTRIVIIDDHTVMIEMLRKVLESMPHFTVVGQAGGAAEGLALCQQLQPDLIILDLALPDAPGLSLLPALKAAGIHARVLVFSGDTRVATVREAMEGGVAGFLEKMCTLEDFRTAVVAVDSGQVYFGSQTSNIIKNLVQRNRPPLKANLELTDREKAVLGYIANGLSSKEIARGLGVSVHTIISHRSNLMRKVGLRRIGPLVLYAAKIGLVGDPVIAGRGIFHKRKN